MDKALLDKVLALQEQAKGEIVTICLDWLSVYYTHTDLLPASFGDGDTIKLSENLYLLGHDKPTLHFNSRCTAVLDGEEVATLLFNSKNEKFFALNVVKVEIKNHALYSGVWQTLLEDLQKWGLAYKSTGRVDIAIDGMGSVHQLLNVYTKQTAENRTVCLKNSSHLRARFDAKVLNTGTMLFENFNIGSTRGNKMITLYNKSLELVKSGKKYIQEFWLRNGLIKQAVDLDTRAIELEKMEAKGYETYHLEGLENIYRFELRLKSESIKEIVGFHLGMLCTASGLASIVKVHCRKFFEPVLADHVKPEKCTPIQLIPYDRLEAVPINKISRVETDGAYKAKITIHGIVQDIYRCRIEVEQMVECITAILDRVSRYKLGDYISIKLIEWGKRYRHAIPVNMANVVDVHLADLESKLQEHLIDRFQKRIDEKRRDDLAVRHGQAGATAAFGE